ncbi:MAG: hypothetical protein Q9185_004553 [Variospora sp. 1 TL-2023]
MELMAERNGGTIFSAPMQRNSIVAVRVQRLLLEAISEDTMREGLDSQTYVYTATIDDSQMSFWVNFAVVKRVSPSGPKIVNYHMEHVYSYNFRSPDAELYLRRVCHNILDWGVRGRREMYAPGALFEDKFPGHRSSPLPPNVIRSRIVIPPPTSLRLVSCENMLHEPQFINFQTPPHDRLQYLKSLKHAHCADDYLHLTSSTMRGVMVVEFVLVSDGVFVPLFCDLEALPESLEARCRYTFCRFRGA